MAMLPFAQPPLYARIDMVRMESASLALIEAELIEPDLYALQAWVGGMVGEAVLTVAS